MIAIFIPSSGTIDVNEDESFPITYNIADIRQPDKRNASFTKTIKLPGTKNNHSIFGWLFDVNISATRFNPNKRVSCVVLNDSIPILEGVIQLLSIEVKDNNEIVYECNIMGNTIDLFTNIGDNELRDLDFSEYDHRLNYPNISASWSATPGSGYVYPMIDYGKQDHSYWNLEDFFPAIYAKTYIDKIIQDAGFTHSSTFLNSSFFKNLIIPFNGENIKLTDTEIQNRFCHSMRVGSNQTISVSAGLTGIPYTKVSNDTAIADSLGQYNVSTGELTVSRSGYYNIEFSGIYRIKHLNSTLISNLSIGFQILNFTKSKVLNGAYQYGVLNIYDPSNQFLLNPAPSAGAYSASANMVLKVNQVYLEAGDKLRVNVFGTAPNTHTGFEIEYLTFSHFKMSAANVTVLTGDTLSLNSAVPEKIKQKDFLMGIINLFGLYIDVDKANAKRLLIEPRNDFYSSGTTVNWSNKWDVTEGWDLLPMGALDALKYEYTYKLDSDYWNDLYKKKYDIIYGNREWKIDNDYLKDTKKTEVLFSPTPLVNRSGADRKLSTIMKYDNTGNAIASKHNVRILYWGGLKSTNTPYLIKQKTGASVVTATQYPYAGHLDDPDYPSLDLNFGIPKEIFYSLNPAIYTDNNLFNKYYKNFIEEITDENSKIAKGKFNLNGYDLQAFDFRNIIYVDGAYWRVNKIEFDPTKDDLASVECIKVKNIPTFIPTSGTTYGPSSGSIFPYDYTPQTRTSGKSNDNRYDEDHLVRGYNIFVAENAINVIATGVDLIIGQSKNVAIFNSSGVSVLGGLQNVHVVNSSGITVTESNVSYVNGQKTYSQSQNPQSFLYTSGVITAAQINNCFTSPITLIPAPGSGKYIDLVDFVTFTDYLTGAHTPPGEFCLAYSSYSSASYFSTVGGAGAPIDVTGSLAADVMVKWKKDNDAKYTIPENSGIVLKDNFGNPTGGDVKIYYHAVYSIKNYPY